MATGHRQNAAAAMMPRTREATPCRCSAGGRCPGPAAGIARGGRARVPRVRVAVGHLPRPLRADRRRRYGRGRARARSRGRRRCERVGRPRGPRPGPAVRPGHRRGGRRHGVRGRRKGRHRLLVVHRIRAGRGPVVHGGRRPRRGLSRHHGPARTAGGLRGSPGNAQGSAGGVPAAPRAPAAAAPPVSVVRASTSEPSCGATCGAPPSAGAGHTSGLDEPLEALRPRAVPGPRCRCVVGHALRPLPRTDRHATAHALPAYARPTMIPAPPISRSPASRREPDGDAVPGEEP